MSGVLNQGALSTNRQGRLTLFQYIGLVPLILIGGIVFLIAIGISGWSTYNNIHNTLTNQLITMVIVVPISLSLIYLAYMIGGKQLIDLIAGKVSQVEGRGTKSSSAGSGERGSTQRNLWYSVGKINFQIAFYGKWKALPGETMVRAYYTPLSKTLVNVEPIYSQTSPPEGARGSLKQDEELEGLQRLDKAEKAAKKLKKG